MRTIHLLKPVGGACCWSKYVLEMRLSFNLLTIYCIIVSNGQRPPVTSIRQPSIKNVKVAHTRLPSVRVPELIPVLGSQPAGDVSHKPGGRPPLLSAGPAVTLATLKRAATNIAAW